MAVTRKQLNNVPATKTKRFTRHGIAIHTARPSNSQTKTDHRDVTKRDESDERERSMKRILQIANPGGANSKTICVFKLFESKLTFPQLYSISQPLSRYRAQTVQCCFDVFRKKRSRQTDVFRQTNKNIL